MTIHEHELITHLKEINKRYEKLNREVEELDMEMLTLCKTVGEIANVKR